MADSKNEIINIIKNFIKKLDGKIKVDKVYLFGSYAINMATEWSDIDIALVSPDFEGVRFFDKQKVNPFIIDTDLRLEVHPFKTGEFNENEDFFVHEILENGIEIKL